MQKYLFIVKLRNFQKKKKKNEKKKNKEEKEVDWDIYLKKNCKCEMCVSVADKMQAQSQMERSHFKRKARSWREQSDRDMRA